MCHFQHDVSLLNIRQSFLFRYKDAVLSVWAIPGKMTSLYGNISHFNVTSLVPIDSLVHRLVTSGGRKKTHNAVPYLCAEESMV